MIATGKVNYWYWFSPKSVAKWFQIFEKLSFWWYELRELRYTEISNLIICNVIYKACLWQHVEPKVWNSITDIHKAQILFSNLLFSFGFLLKLLTFIYARLYIHYAWKYIKVLFSPTSGEKNSDTISQARLLKACVNWKKWLGCLVTTSTVCYWNCYFIQLNSNTIQMCNKYFEIPMDFSPGVFGYCSVEINVMLE